MSRVQPRSASSTPRRASAASRTPPRASGPGARSRLGVALAQLQLARAVTIALQHARSGIAGALALGPVARERDEGPVEVHELVRVHRAPAKVPRRVRRERGEQLHAAEAAELVAVGVDLRDANGKRLAEAGRLE